MAGYRYLCYKTIVKICVFVLYMHYTHPDYWTSICGKNCTYCNRIFTVFNSLEACIGEPLLT